jgi:hypothetical protein
LTYGALRKAETGDYQALPNQPKGSNHKITNWEKFREFAVVHGDKTQVEMAQLWEEKISDRTISRALKKIGFTRKKSECVILGSPQNVRRTQDRLMVTEKEMKLNNKNF